MGISVFLFLTGIIFVAQTIIPADALSRSDLDEIKENITAKNKKIKSLDSQISEQKITIQNMEKITENKKQELREARNNMGSSWDALLSLEQTEKDFNDSKISLEDARKKLLTLLNEKSQLIISNKLLNSDLIKAERELKNQRPEKYDYSHITKLIGVQLSNSCIKLIQAGFNENCPTYEDLVSLDTSLTEYSGEFEHSNGYYHRAEPPYQNSWRIYDNDDTIRIIIDPPAGMAERIKLITINPNFSIYHTIEDMNLDNNTRTWHEGRYIEDCKRAFIGTDNWRFILPDTIFTFHNHCTKTNLETLKSESMPYTDLPIDQTRYWKDKVWLEESKERCKGLCFEY